MDGFVGVSDMQKCCAWQRFTMAPPCPHQQWACAFGPRVDRLSSLHGWNADGEEVCPQPHLVGGIPTLWKILVSWGYYSQYMEKIGKIFLKKNKPPTRIGFWTKDVKKKNGMSTTPKIPKAGLPTNNFGLKTIGASSGHPTRPVAPIGIWSLVHLWLEG